MIRRIFLDLDGVCNRLIMLALEFHGCGVTRYDDAKYPTPGNYDIIAAAQALSPGTHWSQEIFWNSLPLDVWASAPPSDEFPYLLTAAEELVGRSNVYFLTKPVGAESAAGKVMWIERFAPSWLHKQYMIGSRKSHCASPDSLLIDDSDAEVDAFRKAGGQAFLLPRPWNSRFRFDPSQCLASFLESKRRQRIESDLPAEQFAAIRQCGLLREAFAFAATC